MTTKAKQTALAVPAEALPIVGNRSDILGMMRTAIEKPDAVAAIKELCELHEKMLRLEAEQAFNAALEQFHRSCPTITRNKTGGGVSQSSGTKMTWQYADLDQIQKTINPVLSECGLYYTFDSEPISDGVIRYVCTVCHSTGHKKTSGAIAPLDDSRGSMTTMQRYGSSETYGRRRALCLALGLHCGDTSPDVDGQGLDHDDAKIIDAETLEQIATLIDRSGANEVIFREFFGIRTVSELPASRADEAFRMLREREQKTSKQK